MQYEVLYRHVTMSRHSQRCSGALAFRYFIAHMTEGVDDVFGNAKRTVLLRTLLWVMVPVSRESCCASGEAGDRNYRCRPGLLLKERCY